MKPENVINLEEEKSSNSTISLDNFCHIFSEENIKEIYKFNTNPILTKKNFMNLRKDRFEFLKDLSNNSDIYFSDKHDNKFIRLQQYDDLFDSIKTFIDSNNTQTMYLFGPKGISKTTFLLFLKNLLLDVDIYSIFLDYFYLNKYKNEFEKIKKIIFHELLYSFSNYEDMCLFEKEKIFHFVESQNNTLLFINKFLKKFLEILVNLNIKNKIVIILDNIHLLEEDGCDDEDLFLKKIISVNNSCYSKVKMILSGSGKFFNEKFFKFHKDYEIHRFSYPEAGYFLQINKEDLRSINCIKLFDDKIEKINFNTFEENIISTEENYLSKYPLIGLFHTDSLDEKKLSKKFIQENENIFI